MCPVSAGHHHSSAHYGNKDAVRAVIVSAVALGLAALAEITSSVVSGSASVLADGLHNSGDVLTSFILLFTFALVRRPATRRFSSGYGRFEDVATLLIIVVIIVMAAVDPTIVDEITDAAKSVSGVLQVHDVRVRWVGRELVAVMHVACNPKSTLEDAHALAMRVEDAVCHEVPAARLDIHMDPGTAKHKHAVVGSPLDPDDDDGDHDHHHDGSHEPDDHQPLR